MDQGELARFESFASAQGPRLHRLAYLLCGDWHDAQDAAQNALAKIYLAWGRVSTADDPAAYGRRVLVNALRSGRRKRRPVLDLGREADRAQPDGTDVRAERDALMRLLLELPLRQRAVIALRYFEDLSEADVAHVLGINVGTVKSQTSKALARLRSLNPAEMQP